MLIDKQNLPLVAMEFMNDVHLEDVQIINDLYNLILKFENESSNETKKLINYKYEEWYSHTIKHFRGEEVMMMEKKFPPYLFHKGEHDNCLNTMETIFKNWKETSDIMILKNYLSNDLTKWLINHIQTMDTVTAMFLKTGISPCQSK